ncbi:MAG: hypothetical protein JNL51_17195 [Chitinophagaceae bacterium]|nr:hypothetical protein [Chitinophagaceae bacterium]
MNERLVRMSSFGLAGMLLLLFLVPSLASAQSNAFAQGDKHLQFLERLEIMLQRNPDLNLYSPKSISRHMAVDISGLQDSSSGNPTIRLTKTDQQNLQSLLRNNAEWVTRVTENKRTFYRNPANLVEVSQPKFFFALNPVFQVQYALEQDNQDRVHLNTGGVSLRGLINNRIGFYAYGTRNLETLPSFGLARIREYGAVPGAGNYKEYSGHVFDYYDIRAGVSFTALKYFDVQLAYDKNFIGNGYRSLFLSDYGNSNLFLKVNTRIWKLRYQHLYTALTPEFSGRNWKGNLPFTGKLGAFHHLSLNATKWLSVGLFQAIIMNDRSGYVHSFPLMFAPISQITNKKPANDLAGIDFKANLAKKHQVYGQFLMDQLILKNISDGKGHWDNRLGVQLGARSIDLFGIENLDLQVEMNMVRPFTYGANDSLSNYSHYRQMLAHPLGANFAEGIAILHFQPGRKLTTSAKFIFWTKGVDSASLSFGGNIFKRYSSRPSDLGYTIPSGMDGKGLNAQLAVSYELWENLFLDATALIRNWKVPEDKTLDRNTSVFSLALRMNMFKREYDY